MVSRSKVVVLGAGVAGLTSALALLEADFDVEVRTDRMAPDITSSVAAGLWYPYKVSGSQISELAIRTLRWYRRLRENSATGVRLRRCRSVVPTDSSLPSWIDEDVEYQKTERGFDVTLPVADSSLFLPWLKNRIEELGGRILVNPTPVESFDSIEAPTIVNCTGLGARELCGDERLYPIKGTVVLVQNPGIDYCLTDDVDPDLPTYFIPLSTGLVLGGTAETGSWDTSVDPELTADIVSRCAQHESGLIDARIMSVKSGLRPARDQLRLEKEVSSSGKTLIHNYGHGGSGYTLAWGCAEAARHLVSI